MKLCCTNIQRGCDLAPKGRDWQTSVNQPGLSKKNQTKPKPPQQCRPSRTKGSCSSPERALSQAFLAPSLTPRKVPLNLTAIILICLHQAKSSHQNNLTSKMFLQVGYNKTSASPQCPAQLPALLPFSTRTPHVFCLSLYWTGAMVPPALLLHPKKKTCNLNTQAYASKTWWLINALSRSEAKN